MMGDLPIRRGPEGLRRAVVRTPFAVAFLCLAIPAVAEVPRAPEHAPGARGAMGSISHFQESPGGHILYLEEKGGILSPLTTPVPGGRREAIPAFGTVGKARAPAARATNGPVAASRSATGKPAPSGDAGTRP